MKNNIRNTSALIYAVLISLFGILHVSWVFGGSLFLSKQRGGPWKNSLPVNIELLTWIGISLMFLAAILALGRVKLIWKRIPQWFYAISCWVITTCMFLGAIINFIGPSFRAHFVWGPFWFILFILMLTIALPEKKNT
jgi:hypothetical protein